MLLAAHIGIALGTAFILEQVTGYVTNYHHRSGGFSSAASRNEKENTFRQDTLKRIFDFRFWTIGSILPDLIDKPVGNFLFSGFFGYNGRIFSHTLLFTLVLLMAWMALFRKHRGNWLLPLSLGVFIHLLLDSMWLDPVTFFWPFLGWSFPVYGPYDWLEAMAQTLFYDPSAFIPEIIGAVIILVFILNLVSRQRVSAFFRSGQYR